MQVKSLADFFVIILRGKTNKNCLFFPLNLNFCRRIFIIILLFASFSHQF